MTTKLLLFSLMFLGLMIALDVFLFFLLRTSKKRLWVTRRQAIWFHISLHLLLLSNIFLRIYVNDDKYSTIVFSVWMLFFSAKMWIMIFGSGLKLLQLFDWLSIKIGLKHQLVLSESRRDFVKKGIVLGSALPFIGIWHGIAIGKYNYTIHKEALYYSDLPEAFEGFKIVQISDLHLGSFKNMDEVMMGMDLINKQAADILLFTGDMVNYRYDEVEPWRDVLSGLDARYGKYSVLGNHDYGDYVRWKEDGEKERNLEDMCQIQEDMGFRLLRNQNEAIELGSDKIFLAGSENWGKGRFQKYGDIDKTLEGIPEEAFTVLMSHDPSHFDHKVVPHKKNVNLTLSGHTHGMQFGVEIPGFVKWSPAKFQYPKWAGLYDEGGQKLYVNRGFGFIGFPGRVGIWPEITVISLHKA